MIEKIFKAYDVRATYPSPLNEDAAWKVGHATALFLKRNRQTNPDPKVTLNDTIVIGRDMRPHSPALAAALSDGIRSVGVSVIDCGMVDTSFIYFAVNHIDCVGGIMVTASHNPVQYHPEASPGPHDAAYLFDAFIEMMKTKKPPPANRLKELQSLRERMK